MRNKSCDFTKFSGDAKCKFCVKTDFRKKSLSSAEGLRQNKYLKKDKITSLSLVSKATILIIPTLLLSMTRT